MEIIKKEIRLSKSLVILLWIIGIFYIVDKLIEILSFFKIL
jgi:hypothetical protein